MCALVAGVVVAAQVEGLDCGLFADVAACAHNDYNYYAVIDYWKDILMSNVCNGLHTFNRNDGL